MVPLDVVPGDDGVVRCWWAGGDELYREYHDSEWGFAQGDDVRLFEKVCLEGFQSGLSWITILRKRENFRLAFAAFDPFTVAGFDEEDVARLLGDSGIVRHRGKIEATINNAGRAIDLIGEWGSLAAYFWSFEPPRGLPPKELVASTEVSASISRDLKQRGWKFVGPTTMYAFMQAMGLVNDHVERCDVRDAAERARASFAPPHRSSKP
jgi:DNA-3-methyladenine glycosylase I